jgi:uncharacterized protein
VDQEDALALATELDDVVDYTEEAADFLALYNVEAPMEQAIKLTAVLRGAGREIAASLSALGQLSELRPHLVEIPDSRTRVTGSSAMDWEPCSRAASTR